MQPLKAGDKLSPVVATHVVGVKEIAGVVFRVEWINQLDQPMDTADLSPSFIMKSAQARMLAQALIAAADGIDAAVGATPFPAPAAKSEEDSLADLLAGGNFQIRN